MFEAVGNVNGSSGASVIQRSTATSSSAEAAASVSASGVVPLSPRLQMDPVAGIMVTQYLTEDGDLSSQFPSTTVVAYLRSGLSADGSTVTNSTTTTEA